jgi:hypothetical protein
MCGLIWVGQSLIDILLFVSRKANILSNHRTRCAMPDGDALPRMVRLITIELLMARIGYQDSRKTFLQRVER